MKPERQPEPLTKGRLAEQNGKVISHVFGKQHLVGADVKAWVANGLEELRSVFTPTTHGVEMGNTPGTMFTPTTGEQTAERLGESHDVPKPGLDELRGYAKDRAAEALQQMQGQQRGPEKGLER